MSKFKSSTHPIPLSPDPRSFISALLRCRTQTQIKQVHAQAITTSMAEDLGVANKLLYIYAEHKALADARSLFRTIHPKNNITWSVMVGAFAKTGQYKSCLETFRDFVRSGSKMDNFTLPFALRACRDTGSVNLGTELHQTVYKAGFGSDVFVLAAVVDMYAKCGYVEDARKVFDRIPKRDLVTWTVMISGYAECGNPEEALVLFERMKEEGVVPDKVTMLTIVFACTRDMHKARANEGRKSGLGSTYGGISPALRYGRSSRQWPHYSNIKEIFSR